MRLIIVESPAKCQKIQGFLGPGHTVIASMGHIRALAHDLDAVGINNNFEPTYEFLKEKAKAIKQLTDAAKGATSVVLCADDDREGEAIAYSVAVLLKLNIATNPRAAFREITRNAVLDAVNNPRTIDMNRVNSQQSRAMLDMMVGFTISPLLWSYVGPALSAGRCQTPALRLVVERERVIETFKSEGSWIITGEWSTNENAAPGQKWPAAMTESLSDEESAQNYLENHKDNKVGIVKKAETKPWTESAPLALMTSTLQQQASNLYKCNPKKTMQIAQKLYEAGHITYMRTDQETMSEEAVENAKKVILAKWGATYVKADIPPVAATEKTKKASAATAAELPKAQEAHEAIRPTHFENSQLPEGEDWGTYEKKIYHLIWLRAIQSVMSAAKGENRLVTFEAEGDDGDFEWLAKWRRTSFPGWKAADEKDAKISEAQDSETNEADASELSWRIGGALAPTQRVYWQLLLAKPQESKPPGRYTEASLVRELEKKGIGRPSTFASLIATLLEKAYVETKDIVQEIKESKTYSLSSVGQWPPTLSPFQLKKGGEKLRMVPTALGRSLLDFTVKNFPDLFAYEFTAAMEKRLDQIAEGKEPWKQVLGDTWNSYKDRLAALKKSGGSAGSAGSAGSGGPAGNTNPKVREFGNGLKAVLSAKGPLLLKEGETKEQTVFYGWPGSKSFQSLTESEALAFIENAGKQKVGEAFGELEEEPILRKSGKFGSYFEWKGIRVSAAPGDSLEIAIKKLQEKAIAPPVRVLGPFQIRVGQYGPYLMKAAGGKDKPQFVNIPAGTDLDSLTAQQAGEIFETGLKAKATGGGKGGKGGASGFKKFKKKNE